MPADPTDLDDVGLWGGVFDWPLIGLHTIMAPDGTIISYGTNQDGVQSGLHLIDVWNPVTNTHTTIEHTSHTDLFCTVGLIIPETGQILISGGDARPDGGFNLGVQDVNFYNYTTQTLDPSSTGVMQFARWYGTAVQLGTGQIILIGGRDDVPGGQHYSAYSEVYTPGYGFHTLTDAYIPNFTYGAAYPRSFLTPTGDIWTFSNSSPEIYSIDPTGSGAVQTIGLLPTFIDWDMPVVRFAPDKVLLIGNDNTAWIMDISGARARVHADRIRDRRPYLVEPRCVAERRCHAQRRQRRLQ